MHNLVSCFGVILGSFKARFKQLPNVLTKAVYGPWWWSSGRRACLLLRQSEFESCWSLQFFCNICVWKERKKQKEARVGPLKTKAVSTTGRYQNVFCAFTYIGREARDVIIGRFRSVLRRQVNIPMPRWKVIFKSVKMNKGLPHCSTQSFLSEVLTNRQTNTVLFLNYLSNYVSVPKSVSVTFCLFHLCLLLLHLFFHKNLIFSLNRHQ